MDEYVYHNEYEGMNASQEASTYVWTSY
jgi:hypothetical protein